MQRLHNGGVAGGLMVAAVLAVGFSALPRAAAPSSATLSLTSGPVAWDGFSSAAATSPDGEATCVEGTNCDTFTLTLAPDDYRGMRVHFKASWTIAANDYDVYVHQGSVNGPVISPPSGRAPSTAAEGTFDVNAVLTAH